MSSDEGEDDEDVEDVGSKLNRIRAAQQQHCGQDSDDESESSSNKDGDRRALNPGAQSNLSQVQHDQVQHHRLSQQGFSQDLSQASSQLYCQQPSPAYYQPSRGSTVLGHRSLLAETPPELAAVHTDWSMYAQQIAVLPPMEGADYLTDTHSPFAPGNYLGGKPPRAPSRAPSRAASPATRVPSPANSTASSAQKEKKRPPKKKKTAEEIEEEEKLQRDIDMIISHFKPEYKDSIECEDERDLKNLEDKEFHCVARWLRVNKPIPRRLDLSLFNSRQIRKLATQCGVRGGGNMTLFQARKKMALAINMGVVYSDKTIANPSTTATERKVNTLMRITNACFHSDLKDRFIDLNDAKKRADYEKAHGGNPVKDFWVQVSEFTNDSTRNDVLGVVLEAREGEDTRLRDFVIAGEFNLNDWTVQTYLSCQQNMSDCMKARENCLRGLRMSGHHSPDLWTYATNPANTKLRKASLPVPAQAVYYCHVLCEKNPDIDGKFASFLSEKLKSDSEVDLTGDAGVAESGNKRKAAVLDTLVETLSKATSEMTSAIDKKKATREAVQDSQTWSEYFIISDKFLELNDQPNKLPLLRNMSIRVRMLEKKLGISSEQSVCNGIAGVPPIAEVVTLSTKDSTSEITNR
jgi:hypothetical protein